MKQGDKVMIAKWDEYQNYDPDITKWKVNLEGLVGEVQRVNGDLIGIHYNQIGFYAGSVPISLVEIVYERTLDDEIQRIAQNIEDSITRALQSIDEALDGQSELDELVMSINEERIAALNRILDLIQSELDRYAPIDDGHDSPNSPDGGVY